MKLVHFHNLFIVLKSIRLWQSKATMWEWPKGVDQRGWQLARPPPPPRIRDLWPVRLISCRINFLGRLLLAFTRCLTRLESDFGEALVVGMLWLSKKVEQRTSRWYTCVRNSFLKVHNFTFKILTFKGGICKVARTNIQHYHFCKLHVVKNIINMGHRSWTRAKLAHINHDSMIDMPCCIEKTLVLTNTVEL